MRRFRLFFPLFSIALLAPIAFLAYRAIDTANAEVRMEHRVVAERVFDEMERALSRLLESEEERPHDSYLDDGGNETYPFISGRFEMGPNGDLLVAEMPAEKDDIAPAKRGMRATVGKAQSDLESTLTGYYRAEAAPKAKEEQHLSQRPGTTVVLDARGRANVEGNEAAGDDGAMMRDELSTLDALRALNKGAQDRFDRLEAGERARLAQRPSLEREMAAADLHGAHQELRGQVPSDPHGVREALAAPLRAPMSGRLLDTGNLLLVRTVVRAGAAYHQGAVIELGNLSTWLRQQTIGDQAAGLDASVVLSTAPAKPADPIASSAYAFRHRFAPPFDDVTARLSLGALPGSGGLTYVYTLSLLLLGAATIGLAAIYRMVSVAVSFAERRSNFVASVTHELKTPLTAIRMYGEMLRDGIVPSEAKRDEYYRHITAESERLSRLIDNVLEFSRLEKGNRDVSLAKASVVPVVKAVVEALGPHLASCGFQLRSSSDEELPPVAFDRDALVQVLFNLVDNALKYARDSEPKEIELRAWLADGSVCLAVRDHGPGVPRGHLGRIFEPFYRGENELTRRSKGTGLGLALVRGLCERMGARVDARNIESGGFEVEIRLSLTTPAR